MGGPGTSALPLLRGLDRLPRARAPARPLRPCCAGTTSRTGDLPGHRSQDPLERRRPLRLKAPPWGAQRLAATGRRSRSFNEAYYRRAPSAGAPRGGDRLRTLPSGRRLGAGIASTAGAASCSTSSVVPFGREETLRTAVERLQRRWLCALVPRRAEAVRRPARPDLSFPMLGLDAGARRSGSPRGAWPRSDALDEIRGGGRGAPVPIKDSRLRPELLAAMYPELERWRETQRRGRPGGRDAIGSTRKGGDSQLEGRERRARESVLVLVRDLGDGGGFRRRGRWWTGAPARWSSPRATRRAASPRAGLDAGPRARTWTRPRLRPRAPGRARGACVRAPGRDRRRRSWRHGAPPRGRDRRCEARRTGAGAAGG